MVDISHSAGRLLRYMPRVQFRKHELRLVEVAWDNLSLLSSLSSLSSDASSGTDLGRARQDFAALSNDMMGGLESEGLKNALDNLGSKAQVCIDIMVRNLFERTADIGFFATDAVMADYLTQGNSHMRSEMEARLREYASKYSVYSDIYLFDMQGNLQASLIPHPQLAQLDHTQDQAFLKGVQASQAPYVEHYARHYFCDQPDQVHQHTLLYAHQVTAGRKALGVLCLQFNLADEMPAIFNAIAGNELAGDGVVLAVVNAQGGVIGSNDPLQAPVGWQFAQAAQAGSSTVRHLGREYLMVVCDAHGFQGYCGPGWRGLAMLPLDMAFDDDETQSQSPLMAEVARNTDLLAAELRSIPLQSAAIQATLERSVWNGLLNVNRLDSDASSTRDVTFSRTLLSEIGNTAHKTAQAFANALQDLHSVVIRSLLRDVQGRASLAMQILDRNLYERANDCRWWAQTPQFVDTLRRGTLGCAQATEVLSYINSLYTVYTSLVLFDAHGVVLASSTPAHTDQLGQTLRGDWVQQTLSQNSSQDYAVGAFASSPFSPQNPTFIYAAAVRDSTNGSARVLGGIGVVWDAASQLSSILADCGDGFSAQDLLAFVDAKGHFVAVHGHASLLPTPQAVAQCRTDEHIVALGGGLYGAGFHRGYGYREFRVHDGYDHGLSCVVLRNLCPVRTAAAGPQLYRPSTQVHRLDAAHAVHMATFSVAGYWLGLPAEQVVQAAPDVTILSGGTPCPPFLGFTQVGIKVYPVIDLRSVIARHADGKTTLMPVTLDQDSTRQLILVRVTSSASGKSRELALRVDALGAVLEVDARKIQELGGSRGEHSNGAGLVDAVIPVLTGHDDGQALLSRVSQRWLQLCAGGLQKEFAPQDLAGVTARH
ncbi:MAG: CheW domain-containing protein [Comamonadaceae bacterium]|nr:MAG: CheW domain-containing protein [Comamonadaceae bacterium]